jgi:uncharacterized DUF497 family protein
VSTSERPQRFLDDTLSTTFPDLDHSVGERRFLIIGMSALGRILVVSHTESADIIRIVRRQRAALARAPRARCYRDSRVPQVSGSRWADGIQFNTLSTNGATKCRRSER